VSIKLINELDTKTPKHQKMVQFIKHFIFFTLMGCVYVVTSQSRHYGTISDETKEERRESVFMSRKLILKLVTERCPSQVQKTAKHFLSEHEVSESVKKAEELKQKAGGTESEKVLYWSEFKALEAAEILCEGAVDDLGEEAYSLSIFYYPDFKEMLQNVHLAVEKQRNEEAAEVVAQKAYQDALKARMYGNNSQPETLEQELKEFLNEESGYSFLFVGSMIILIGGGLGLVCVKAYVEYSGDRTQVNQAFSFANKIFVRKGDVFRQQEPKDNQETSSFLSYSSTSFMAWGGKVGSLLYELVRATKSTSCSALSKIYSQYVRPVDLEKKRNEEEKKKFVEYANL